MATIRSNVVTITDKSNTITGISYVDNSLVITKDQPSKMPVTIVQKKNVWEITLQAGRKKSSPVAEAFKAKTGGEGHAYAPSGGGGGTPKELNFFYEVVVSFQTEAGPATARVYLGQGSYLTTNNWWIGGSGVNSNAGKPVLELSAGNKIATVMLSGTHDSFTLERGTIHRAYPIKHVFVVMLENHSFDNIFAMSNIPGIKVASTKDFNRYNGKDYHVRCGAPKSMPTDPGHEFLDVLEQLAGPGATYHGGSTYPPINNSGFASNYATSTTEGPTPPASDIGDIMACFDTPSQLPVIYQLAKDFTICDRWFSSLPGPTWPNRFFVHGASSGNLDDSPSTKDMLEWEFVPGEGFTLPHGSIYQAMNNKDISWRLYNDSHNIFSNDPQNGSELGRIPQVAALKGISIFDVHSLSNFASDLKKDYSYEYTFIEPNYGDIWGSYAGGSSQHPMDDVYGGEKLLKYVYESIRNSPVWDSSLLIITYDEHGGFYDSVAPGTAVPPKDNSPLTYNKHGFNFRQYGVRVPAVIVSPWVAAKADNKVYDHSSVLATVEKLFGLNPLTDRDANANNLTHLFLPALRTDCPKILPNPAPPMAARQKSLTSEELATIDSQPLPESGNLPGFLAIARKTELELSSGDATERTAIAENFRQIETIGEAKAYVNSVMKRVDQAKAARE